MIKLVSRKAGTDDEDFKIAISDNGHYVVISICGFLCFGAYQKIKEYIVSSAMNEKVSRIILFFNSPGGEVDGVSECADVIHKISESKPIIACGNMCHSAAFWLASACSQLFLSDKTSSCGSIGIVAQHIDRSKKLLNEGIVVTEIAAGSQKNILTDVKEISEDGKEFLANQCKLLYNIFVGSVGTYKNLSSETVHERWGDGREFIGEEAVNVGIADGIMPLSSICSLQSFNSGKQVNIGGDTMPEEVEVKEEKSTPENGDYKVMQEKINMLESKLSKIIEMLDIAEVGDDVKQAIKEDMPIAAFAKSVVKKIRSQSHPAVASSASLGKDDEKKIAIAKAVGAVNARRIK